MVLFLTPAVVAVTATETVHEPLAAIIPPVSETVVLFAAAVNVPPPQLPTAFGVLATCTPEGNASVKPTPVSVVDAFGLVMVKDSVTFPFKGVLPGVKLLLMLGGATTVTVADAVPPVPPSVEVTAPVVLFFTPAVVPVMLTEMVQVAPPARVPPEKLKVVAPGLGANVPQGALAFGVVDPCKPDGNTSVKLTPLNAVLGFGLVKVNAKVTVAFTGIVVIGTDAVPPPDAASPVFVSA